MERLLSLRLITMGGTNLYMISTRSFFVPDLRTEKVVLEVLLSDEEVKDCA